MQADWNQSDNTKDDFIKNKPTLRQPSTDGTSGQYLKSNGNGNAPSWETMDSAPTENSTKAVTSGGVKTALDGKQASMTITMNANTPTDNDTVIMQDNGNTGTTSFLRRKLSVLWTYIKGKADGVYVPFGYLFNKINVNGLPVANRLYDVLYDDALYGADERFSVSRTIYSNATDEVIGTLPAANIFKAVGNRYANHPSAGEREVILIQPKSLSASDSIFTYGYGDFILDFDYNQMPDSVKIRFRKRNEEWTQYYDVQQYSGTMFRYGNTSSASTATYLNAIEVVIYGKNTGNNTTSLVNFFFVSYRPSNGRSGLTKHSSDKDIYGNITAPKFIKRGGTNKQVLLANGDTASLPLTIANGGTGQTTAQSACNAFINALSTGTATPTDSDYYVCQYAGGGTSTTTYHRRPMSSLWNWIKTHFDSSPTSGSDNGITSGGVYSALGDYFPLAGKKAITGVYKNAPSFIHNVDFGNTSTEGIWRKFCVISTRQTYRNAVGEIHINARSTQGTIYLTIGSSATTPPEGANNTLNPSVKYLSMYNDYRPVYWRVNDDNELELWWKATQYYDSVGVTGVNFSPYFLSLGSDYNAGVNVQWTDVVSLSAPANLSQAQDVSLTTLDVSAGDVLTIDGDNYQDYLRTPSGGIPTSVLEADRIVLPRAYSTIFFDTNYTATISYILGATGSNVQKNGRRITVAGNWKPREESSGDGRFTQYLYRYRGGVVGSQFADRLREAYEDFVYFNGIWYSKGY